MAKFKVGDKVWWKVDGVLREGIVKIFKDGFYGIRSTSPGTMVMCSVEEEGRLHHINDDLWEKGTVVDVEVCEVEELCEGTGEPISECQCNVCMSHKPVITLEGDGTVYVVREEGEPK